METNGQDINKVIDTQIADGQYDVEVGGSEAYEIAFGLTKKEIGLHLSRYCRVPEIKIYPRNLDGKHNGHYLGVVWHLSLVPMINEKLTSE